MNCVNDDDSTRDCLCANLTSEGKFGRFFASIRGPYFYTELLGSQSISQKCFGDRL